MAGNRKSGTSQTVTTGNKGSALRPETIVSGQTTGIQAGQGSVGTAGTVGIVQAPPTTSMLRPVGNLFSESRAGEAVVRVDDLLAMRVQLINVGRKPGSGRAIMLIEVDANVKPDVLDELLKIEGVREARAIALG